MNHEFWSAQLDDYVDGTLPEPQHVALQAHLDTCDTCAAEVEALRKLLAAARQLSPSVALRRDLWPELAGRLPAATDRNPRRGHATSPPHRRAFSPATTWLAAAAAVILLATTVWIWQGRKESTEPASVARGTRHSTTASHSLAGRDPVLASDMVHTVVAALERECMAAGKMLQASLAAGGNAGSIGSDGGDVLASTLSSGLLMLDDCIAETLAALEQDPGDATLMKLLMLRYQQKLSLLHGAIEIVEEV